MPEYIRDEEAARELARRDRRVAMALTAALAIQPTQTLAEKGWPASVSRRATVQARVSDLAALTVVELYRYGHRCGWDGVRACATWFLAQPARQDITPQQFALELIADGSTLYDPTG